MNGFAQSLDENCLVWDHLRHHAEEEPDREAIVHWSIETEPRRWSWGSLISAASYLSHWLKESGVRSGDVCALIVKHNFYFYPTYLALSAIGALPAVLAYPNPRLHPDKFRQGLRGMAHRSGLDFILTERSLEPLVAPLVTQAGTTVRQILFPLEAFGSYSGQTQDFSSHAPARSTDPVLLQHSSGTTGLQKPVVLSHQAVLRHVVRYGEAIGLAPTDKIVSWLPLYHDMGLIAAYYLPLVCGVPLVQLDPFEWVSAPVSFLQAASGEQATLAWLPNFSYNFMADRIHEEDLTGLRLDSLRMVVNCSEPVRVESHEKFYARFRSYGLRRGALAACYAMAETTFAATQTLPGCEATTLEVSREELAKGRVVLATGTEGIRRCVSSGRPIRDCSIRIVDELRVDVEPGLVGEIAIASASLFDGYRNYPEKTAEVLSDGWYFSGDYGFIHDGECYVIGRKKDVIILAGNNVFPEDVEDVMGRVDGVIPGRVVAFGADDDQSGTEILCVVAETAETAPERVKKVRMDLLKAGMAMDVTIARVYLVPPRWLIKSSSGKPSRSANKERALGELKWK